MTPRSIGTRRDHLPPTPPSTVRARRTAGAPPEAEAAELPGAEAEQSSKFHHFFTFPGYQFRLEHRRFWSFLPCKHTVLTMKLSPAGLAVSGSAFGGAPGVLETFLNGAVWKVFQFGVGGLFAAL